MARTVLPIAGAVVGAFFGAPQLGFIAGSIIASAVPTHTKGPRIGETGAQTSQEGSPRAIIRGTCEVTGNVICSSPLITGYIDDDSGGGKGGSSNSSEHCYRTYAIRICEGPISQVLRIWEDDKCVYDIRPNAGGLLGYYQNLMNQQWIFGAGIYYGTEDQLPDPFLQINVTADMPAYRGTAYMVFVFRDLTDRRGSIPQYRFEVAVDVERSGPQSMIVGPSTPLGTYLGYDNGQPYLLTGQTNGSSTFEVGYPGQFEVDHYPTGFGNQIVSSTDTYANSGSTPGDNRLWMLAVDPDGYGVSLDGNYGYCKVTAGGATIGTVIPVVGASTSWWYNEGGWFPEYGGLIWYSGSYFYLGVRKTGGSGTAWDRIMKFGKAAGPGTLPVASALNITGSTSNPVFWMHVDQNGICRSIANNGTGQYVEYDSTLSVVTTVNLPATIAARFPSNSAINGFGVDLVEDLAVYVFGGATCYVYRPSTGALLATYTLTGAGTGVTTRVVISDDGIYIQRTQKTYYIAVPKTYVGVPAVLGDIVAEIHQRCGVPASQYDVSELTDQVTGIVFAGDYTGADAIDTLRSCYFFDKAEYDKKLWYPKRGKAVVASLTADDMVQTPDESQREQAVEFPRKLHLEYQNADAAYAVAVATVRRSSEDARVVGESTIQVPVVLSSDQAAQTADKAMKVAWKDAEGEVKFSMPMSAIGYVPSDNVGVTLRGKTSRLRLEKTEFSDGKLDWTLRHDRQSAYTSTLTGIPIPPPTAPPSTLVGDTSFVYLDISPRQESEDNLGYLVAVCGAMDGWYGAAVQRSADGGSSWTTVATAEKPAKMGALVNAIPAASSHYTDRTNVVTVQLYKTTQTLDSISDTQFLSGQGAFALQNADGTYEILQYRDSTDLGGGKFALSTLHRGRLNSGGSAHAVGALFVTLDSAIHVDASAALVGQSIVHRAVSYDQSPEDASQQTNTFTGRSQLEWPPASLSLARDASNIVTGKWYARGRFGTDDAPVNSANLTGWRITIVGSSTVTFDQALTGTGVGQQSFAYDASALGASVTVSVQGLNRFTGPGTASTGTI